jgi:diadenylate cyclase
VNPELSRQLGSRHRAAIGLTEDTDAVVVVVSEETGTISLVYGGRIRRDFDGSSLKPALLDLLEVREAGEGEALPEAAATVAAREK